MNCRVRISNVDADHSMSLPLLRPRTIPAPCCNSLVDRGFKREGDVEKIEGGTVVQSRLYFVSHAFSCCDQDG